MCPQKARLSLETVPAAHANTLRRRSDHKYPSFKSTVGLLKAPSSRVWRLLCLHASVCLPLFTDSRDAGQQTTGMDNIMSGRVDHQFCSGRPKPRTLKQSLLHSFPQRFPTLQYACSSAGEKEACGYKPWRWGARLWRTLTHVPASRSPQWPGKAWLAAPLQ